MNPTPQDDLDKILSTHASDYVWASHRLADGLITDKDMHRKWNEADKKAKSKLKTLIHQERSRAELNLVDLMLLAHIGIEMEGLEKWLKGKKKNIKTTLNQKEQSDESCT